MRTNEAIKWPQMGWAASVWVANVAMAMAKVCNFKNLKVMQGFLDLIALRLLNFEHGKNPHLFFRRISRHRIRRGSVLGHPFTCCGGSPLGQRGPLILALLLMAS